MLFSFLALASCVNKQKPTAEPLPGLLIKSESINTYIKLNDSPEMVNSYKNNDTLDLQIINLSDKSIVFPENFGVKVLAKDGEKWVEVQNNFYNSGGSFVLPTKKDYPLGLLVTVMPFIPNQSSQETLRVIIVGHVENNDSEQVGAYTDVVIKP